MKIPELNKEPEIQKSCEEIANYSFLEVNLIGFTVSSEKEYGICQTLPFESPK